jgi:uncharacterized protein (TIGR00255 family)
MPAARSMTGFGRATREGAAGAATVEVKSVNHRYLKVQARLPGFLEGLDGEIENRLRARLARGAVQVVVDLRPKEPPAPAVLDPALAAVQRDRLEALWRALFPNAGSLEPARIFESLMRLPPAAPAAAPKTDEAATLVLAVLDEALDALQQAREAEGRELAEDLFARRSYLGRIKDGIAAKAPAIVKAAQARFVERINQLLAETKPGVTLDPEIVLRESALIADRGDISEELNRLSGHLARFDEVLAQGAEAGRKLEFLLQEMLREANTIGSKSLDLAISHEVVEIKAEIEKMKEQVQNLE